LAATLSQVRLDDGSLPPADLVVVAVSPEHTMQLQGLWIKMYAPAHSGQWNGWNTSCLPANSRCQRPE
jgi:hypothetical protein